MKSSHQSIAAVALTILPVFGASLPFANADEPPQQRAPIQLRDIMSALQKRQRAARSVYIKVEGEVLVPRGCFSDAFPGIAQEKGVAPPEDYNYRENISWLLDFENNRVRKETEEELYMDDKSAFVPRHSLEIYDGKQIKAFTPKNLNTSSKYTPSKYQPDLILQEDQYKKLAISFLIMLFSFLWVILLHLPNILTLNDYGYH